MHIPAMRQYLALLISFVVVGCGSGGPDAATSTNTNPGADADPATTTTAGIMRLSGTVRSRSSRVGLPNPLADAEVKATIDRNRDGTITPNETYVATSDFDGTYTLDVPVNAGDTLVLRVGAEGSAPMLRTVRAAPKGNMIINATLRQFDPLICTRVVCSLEQGGLTMKGLPQGTGGGARLFNPLAETDAFPGDFADSTGALLRAGVFASVDLQDLNGNRLQTVPAPFELRLRIPRDTWSLLKDITPGNQQIDVPLYSFDEKNGTWVREANPGHLEDDSGHVIPPASLGSIRDGFFLGDVYAVGNVGRLSTWGVVWPTETVGCVSGRIVDESGRPAEGATVSAMGVNYTGRSRPVTVGPDGRFCLEAIRSEGAGEDLDGDGMPGEKATVSISATAGGNVYDLGKFEIPAVQGVCGGNGCLELGDLRLGAATLRRSVLCTVTGVVRYRDGTPADGASVLSWDYDVPSAAADGICGVGSASICGGTFGALNGVFTVTSAALDDLTLFSLARRDLETGAAEFGLAGREFASCPTDPVTLNLDAEWIEVSYAVVVGGQTISWAPTRYGVSVVTVRSSGQGIKWQVATEGATVMPTPVTYGVTPPGATQTYPARGTPPPLEPGDDVSVLAGGATVNGIPYFGSGIRLP